MALIGIYTRMLQSELGGLDVRDLAGRWIAGAAGPTAGVAADSMRAAVERALRDVLDRLWPEAWALGQQAARKLTTGLSEVDWSGWTPGDAAAARAIVAGGFRALLADQDATISRITGTQLARIERVLADAVEHGDSVDALARSLGDVVGDRSNSELIAWTELARVQAAAADDTYRQAQVGEVIWASAEDDRVCPTCDARETASPYELDAAPDVPAHPRCRCVVVPVAESIPARAA